MDGKRGTWYSLNIVSQGGWVGELHLISTRKQSFLLKRPKAILPVSWQGLPSCPSTSSQQTGNPNLRRGPPKPVTTRTHCLVSSFEARHLPSPSPSLSQQSPKVQPLLGLNSGGGTARGCGSASQGTLPTLNRNCRWEPRRGAGQGQV